MNAKIDQLTPAEHEWIAEQIDATKLFVAETVGTVQNEFAVTGRSRSGVWFVAENA